jgi:hypothetical protein
MSVAPLLSLGDLEGAMARALDARELAHRVGFEPPLVSAGIVIAQSRSRHRPKYQALGLVTRARAARRLGARSAVEDARAAVTAARDDPPSANR